MLLDVNNDASTGDKHAARCERLHQRHLEDVVPAIRPVSVQIGELQSQRCLIQRQLGGVANHEHIDKSLNERLPGGRMLKRVGPYNYYINMRRLDIRSTKTRHLWLRTVLGVAAKQTQGECV